MTISLAALCSLTEGVGILLLIPGLQVAGVNLQDQGSVGKYSRYIDAALQRVHLAPSISLLLFALLVVLSTRTIMVKMKMVMAGSVQQKIQVYLRERLHRAIIGADWVMLSRNKSSDLVHILTREVERIGTATAFTLMLAGDFLVAAIYVAVAGALSTGVTLMVLGSGLLLTLLLWEKTKAVSGIGSAVTEKNQLLYGAIISHVQNIKATKAYNAEARDQQTFADLNADVSRAGNDGVRKQAVTSGLFEIGSFVILSAAIYISIRILAVGPATILILLLVFARLMPRFVDAHSHYQGVLNQLPAFTTVMALEGRCIAASDPAMAQIPLARLSNRIELANISFAYPTAPGPAIDQLSLSIRMGQTSAFVGPSGSGKSTLADIIIGLLSPDAGRMTIDGVELSAANRSAWRAQVGYVSQDTVLFHDTLRANLAWARPDAGEPEMWQVLKMAAAEDLVRRLPHGLDTVVGDRGALLSHGERQRLAIARALLRKPALLVLDEATNSLDGENEARVLEAIEKLHGSLTILLIAHRFSTVKRADAVYLFERGRIVRSGTWEHLADKNLSLEYFPDPDQADEVEAMARLKSLAS
jgi:ATP-binding cassette, subfamily C, bacterial